MSTPIARSRSSLRHGPPALLSKHRALQVAAPEHVALAASAGVIELEGPEPLARRYLALADRALPGRIVAFYLVGSTALGAFRAGRSDVDFIAVVDRDLTNAELRRLRAVALRSGLRTTTRALAAGHAALPGTMNGAYVRACDLTTPVSSIRPIASHVAASFHRGAAFDVNPVVWKELLDAGVAIRGPIPDTLGLDPEPSQLADWNLANLQRYWKRWAELAAAGRRANSPLSTTGWIVSWGVLGAPRLHRTIATGDVISKEAAGEYALDVFDPAWHPIIRDGLAFLRFEPPVVLRPRKERIAWAGKFVAEVVRSAHRMRAQ